MALKNALLLGQRSRPLAFAGGCVLRPRLLKDRLALLVFIRRMAHCAERLLGRAPRIHGLAQDSAYVLLKYGRLWQHQPLESHSRSPQCGLTPRSRRGPTSKRQARAAGGRIFHRAGLAFCCWPRLSSNVRQHKVHHAVLQQKVRLAP